MEENYGSLLDIDSWHSGKYGNLEQLKELILYKKITNISKDKVELENGITLTIELSESDCCAYGEGEFEFDESNVPLDAVITNFNIGKQIDIPDSDTTVRRNTITLFHNQNPVVKANAKTDAGNGGYYYSITSLVINGIHFPFVEA